MNLIVDRLGGIIYARLIEESAATQLWLHFISRVAWACFSE